MIKKIKIPGITFNQEYQIDDEGNIYSPYNGFHKLNPSPTKKGYYRIVLQTSNGRKTFQVHRLVLQTFNPIENMDKLQVNHIDGDKSNNNLNNLEWCSCKENINHGHENGLYHPARGQKVYGNKLKEEEVLEICELLKNSNMSLREIGELYGVSKHCIYDIKRKRSWGWLTKNYIF